VQQCCTRHQVTDSLGPRPGPHLFLTHGDGTFSHVAFAFGCDSLSWEAQFLQAPTQPPTLKPQTLNRKPQTVRTRVRDALEFSRILSPVPQYKSILRPPTTSVPCRPQSTCPKLWWVQQAAVMPSETQSANVSVCAMLGIRVDRWILILVRLNAYLNFHRASE
jgi:hypothetical protein